MFLQICIINVTDDMWSALLTYLNTEGKILQIDTILQFLILVMRKIIYKFLSV